MIGGIISLIITPINFILITHAKRQNYLAKASELNESLTFIITVQAHRNCFQEFGVAKSVVWMWIKGNDQFKPNKLFNCSFICQLDHVGLIYEKSKINQKKLEYFLKLRPGVYEYCSKFKGDDCAVAFATFSCVFVKKPNSIL